MRTHDPEVSDNVTVRGVTIPVMLTLLWAGWPQIPAFGQVVSSSGSAEAGQPEALQEIVVTAEKRYSTVQETPISMTAVSGEELAAQGRVTLESIAQTVPGISMRSLGPGQTELEMRGLASSGGASPTVGFYLDEISLPPAAGSLNGRVVVDPSLYDLGRVEVLRGPQGTLYGAGSMGGTIKLVTTLPQMNEFSGSAHAAVSSTVGDGFNRGGDAAFNLPLVDDHLAARVVITDRYIDGWIDRVVLNDFPVGTPGNCAFAYCTRGDVLNAPIAKQYPRSNWEELQVGRLDVLWKVGDSTTIRPIAMYQQIRQGDFNEYDSPPGLLVHYQPIDLAEPFSDRFDLFGLTITHEFDGAQLTAVGSYFDRHAFFTGDANEEWQVLNATYFGYTQYNNAPFTESDETLNRSVEVRVASTGESKFQWIGGVFGSDFQSTYDTYAAAQAWAPLSTGGAAAKTDGVADQSHKPYHMDQYAVFSEASLKLTDSLKATVGLRWYKYDIKLNYELTGIYAQTGNLTPYTGEVESSATGYNPKFNLAYIPNANLTAYATIAKGFRPGGVNTPVPVTLCGPNVPLSYSPDSIWSYEIGNKARLLDGRLSINADVYYIQWKDIQQALVDPSCGYTSTINAGDAHSYGPELEISYRLTEGLTATVSGTITKADITSVAPAAQGQVIAVNQPIEKGMTIQDVPKYTAFGTLTYERPISDGYTLTGRLMDSYVGPSYDVGYYFTQLPGYNLASARLGLAHGHWEAYLFGDNLFNKQADLSIYGLEFDVQVPTMTRPSTNQPRTLGVEGTYRF